MMLQQIHRHILLVVLLVVNTCGCYSLPPVPMEIEQNYAGTLPAIAHQNPLFVPTVKREFLWNQTIDALDDYFRIAHEQRMELVEGAEMQRIITPGRIETMPTIGSTYFEPWRKDSSPGFEKLHSTLQTIRRRAEVEITSEEGGYLVSVIVYKELEDLNRPEHTTVGMATRRHDGSLSDDDRKTKYGSTTLGWIPIGRDIELENRILADLYARVVDLGPPERLPHILNDLRGS